MHPDKRYWHDVLGFNYRMTNLQAAVGVAQLKKLNQFIERKREIAQWYAQELKELEDNGLVELHPQMLWAKCVYWMYSIKIKGGPRTNRDELMKKLAEKGIETRPLFYSIHVMPPYKNDKAETFPVAEKLSKEGLSLPSAVRLEKKDIEFIGKIIRDEIS